MKINYTDFKKELDAHFSDEPHLVTECLIRYLFIKAHKTEAEIEVPYRVLPIKPTKNYLEYKRARVDLYYGNPEDAVFEFKYHRRTKYSDCCTATNMGKVFNDLNRLSVIDKTEKYFIYVFDENMKKYYEKHSPFDILKMSRVNVGDKLNVNGAIDKLLAGGYAEFKKQAFSGFTAIEFKNYDYTIEVKRIETLSNNYNLLIFEIL